MTTKKEQNERKRRTLESAMDRQIKAVVQNAKMIDRAIYDDRFAEARKWCAQMQDSANQIGELLSDICKLGGV